ncbi:MAG TPA: hypothetical protein VLQ93_26140 [Myxococcaceae bacterium]|nr:hypothetical protein [Myxococcaceae bacterium]
MKHVMILAALLSSSVALAASEPAASTEAAPEAPPAPEGTAQPAPYTPRFMVSTSLLHVFLMTATLELEGLVLEHASVYAEGQFHPLAGAAAKLGTRMYSGPALSGFYLDVYSYLGHRRDYTAGSGVAGGYSLPLGKTGLRAMGGLGLEALSNADTVRLQPGVRLQVGYAF